jgi:hypothetical protein
MRIIDNYVFRNVLIAVLLATDLPYSFSSLIPGMTKSKTKNSADIQLNSGLYFMKYRGIRSQPGRPISCNRRTVTDVEKRNTNTKMGAPINNQGVLLLKYPDGNM